MMTFFVCTSTFHSFLDNAPNYLVGALSKREIDIIFVKTKNKSDRILVVIFHIHYTYLLTYYFRNLFFFHDNRPTVSKKKLLVLYGHDSIVCRKEGPIRYFLEYVWHWYTVLFWVLFVTVKKYSYFLNWSVEVFLWCFSRSWVKHQWKKIHTYSTF